MAGEESRLIVAFPRLRPPAPVRQRSFVPRAHVIHPRLGSSHDYVAFSRPVPLSEVSRARKRRREIRPHFPRLSRTLLPSAPVFPLYIIGIGQEALINVPPRKKEALHLSQLSVGGTFFFIFITCGFHSIRFYPYVHAGIVESFCFTLLVWG